MRYLAYLFSFQGRFTAGELWRHGFALMLPTGIVLIGLAAALWQVSQYALVYAFGVAILCQWAGQLSAVVRRLHDLGLSGWWALGVLIAPVCIVAVILGGFSNLPLDLVSVVQFVAFGLFAIAICASLALYIMPGQRRDNRFGPIPDGR